MFLQLGKPAYYYNGRKKAKVALLKSDRVTYQVSKAHEHVSLYYSYVHGQVAAQNRDM